MSNPGSGLVAVIIGLILVAVPYAVLITRLRPSENKHTEASLNLYALKASVYIAIGGLASILLGLIILSQLLG